MMADKYLPIMGYKKRIHLMNPMVPSLNSDGEKMSCSDINSKIDLLDSAKVIKKKINKAFCEEGNINCGLLKFTEMVLFPILRNKGECFVINRPDKFGGEIIYKSFEDLNEDFLNKNLYPTDLKLGISEWLINFLEPLREKFLGEEMSEILKNAY